MSIDLNTYLHDALDRVAHTTSIEAFYHQFAAIRYLVESSQPWLTESYFASRFIYGLHEDFQILVIRFHPVTVTAAYQLACIYEESIYLHYFPESVMQNHNFSVENSVAGNRLVVPCIDKACKEVVVEVFSSVSTSSIGNSGFHLVEESAVDNLASGVAVVSQSEDTLDSLVGYADERMHIVSSFGINEEGFALVHCIIRQQIIYLNICCSWMNVCSSYYLKKNESPARTFQNSKCDNTIGVVPLEVSHFYILWEPGPLASQWHVDKIGRHSNNVSMKSSSPLSSSSKLQSYVVHMIEKSWVQCLCMAYDGAKILVFV